MFVSDKPFKPGLMFTCKAETYSSEAPYRCYYLGWAKGLTHKHNTRLEMPATDKHNSLLRSFVNYGRNIITLGPDVEPYIITFYTSKNTQILSDVSRT